MLEQKSFKQKNINHSKHNTTAEYIKIVDMLKKSKHIKLQVKSTVKKKQQQDIKSKIQEITEPTRILVILYGNTLWKIRCW